MKIWAVYYISPSYTEDVVKVFRTLEKANEWIETHIPGYDRQNYYVIEWEVDE
jgi:hypothetical protein